MTIRQNNILFQYQFRYATSHISQICNSYLVGPSGIQEKNSCDLVPPELQSFVSRSCFPALLVSPWAAHTCRRRSASSCLSFLSCLTKYWEANQPRVLSLQCILTCRVWVECWEPKWPKKQTVFGDKTFLPWSLLPGLHLVTIIIDEFLR